jgi:BirA family biotin operon repressor/biotin-[acetyl-CoA-carboxylase] ligase
MKREILKALKDQKEGFVSGQEMSEKLGVTRAAVWKHIKQLQEEGYEIEAVSRKGYRLLKDPDHLDADALELDRRSSLFGKKVYHFESVDSTNTMAKKLAAEGAAEGTVVIAEEQKAGKGRLGRRWESAKGTGIWLSIILRPAIKPSDAVKITQIAAAAVGEAIQKNTGYAIQIKWPNDVLMDKKKICGILTEMSAELERINFIVVGIGVNVSQKEGDFPSELKHAASIESCTGKTVSRRSLVVEILKEFEELYFDFLHTGSIEKSIHICRKYSATLGNKVKVIDKEKEIIAEAVDITEEGELLIRDESGGLKKIISGEVSVRGLYGYTPS